MRGKGREGTDEEDKKGMERERKEIQVERG